MEENYFPGQKRVVILPNHRVREDQHDLINNHKNVPPPRLLPDPSHPALINYKVDYPGTRVQIAETRPSHMQNSRQADSTHLRGTETPSILFGENNFSAARFPGSKNKRKMFKPYTLHASDRVNINRPAKYQNPTIIERSNSNQEQTKPQPGRRKNRVTLAPHITTSWSLNLHPPSTTSISTQNENVPAAGNQYPLEEYINERIGLAQTIRSYDSHRPLFRSSTKKLIPSPVYGMNGNDRVTSEVPDWSEPLGAALSSNTFLTSEAELGHEDHNIQGKVSNVNNQSERDDNIHSQYKNNNQFQRQHHSSSYNYEGPYLSSPDNVSQREAHSDSHSYYNTIYFDDDINIPDQENHQMNVNNIQGSRLPDVMKGKTQQQNIENSNSTKEKDTEVGERMNHLEGSQPAYKEGIDNKSSSDKQHPAYPENRDYANKQDEVHSSRLDNRNISLRSKNVSSNSNGDTLQSDLQHEPSIRKSINSNLSVKQYREKELRNNEPLRRGIVQDIPQYHHQDFEEDDFEDLNGEVVDFPNKFQRPNKYNSRDRDGQRQGLNMRPKLVSSFNDDASKKAETQSTIYQSESHPEATFKATTADHWYLMPVQGWFALAIILAAVLLVILVVFGILYRSWKRQKTKIANFISPNDIFLGGCIDPVQHELCTCRGLASFVRANQFHERASVMSRLSKHRTSSNPQRAATIGFDRSNRLVDDLRCLPTWKGGLELKDEDSDSIITEQTQMCGTPPPPPLAPKISIGKMSDNFRNFREMEENRYNLNRTLSLSKGLDKTKTFVTHFDRNDGFRKSFASSKIDTYQEVGKISKRTDVNLREPRRTVSSSPKLDFTSEKLIHKPLHKAVLQDDGDVKLTTIYPPPMRFDLQQSK